MTAPTDPGAGGLRTFALAEQVLDAVVQAAMDQGVDLPAKRCVTVGQAVHDCEQVAVVITALNPGIPAGGGGGLGFPGSASGAGFCAPPWSVVLTIEIVRCYDVMVINEIQPGEYITAAMKPPSRDAEVVMGAIDNISTTSFTNVVPSIRFAPPSGGLIATIGNLTLGLP